MKAKIKIRIATILAVVSASVITLVPAASANPVEVGPCPTGNYGVQVLVQTPEGDKWIYACYQP